MRIAGYTHLLELALLSQCPGRRGVVQWKQCTYMVIAASEAAPCENNLASLRVMRAHAFNRGVR
jgi:hypothetical protein